MKPKTRRSGCGHGTIEIAVTAGIMILLVFFAIDIVYLVLGASIAERACRDAARAAGEGRDLATATNLAEAAIAAHWADGDNFNPPRLVNINYQDFGGDPPAGVTPFVTVRVAVDATVPIPLDFLGVVNFSGSHTFSRDYTYPIVKLSLAPPGGP